MKKKIQALCVVGLITLNLQLITHNSISQNVGINGDGTVGDSNTMLDIKATDNTSSTFGLKVKDASNDPKMVVRSDGNIGIGGDSPEATLHLLSGTHPSILVDVYGGGGMGSSRIDLRRANGSFGSPAAITLGQPIGNLSFKGYNGADFPSNANVRITANATENYTTLANGTALNFSTTPNGTIGAATERVTIDHNGRVGIGINPPERTLHVSNDDPEDIAMFDTYGGVANLRIRRANGTFALPTATANTDVIANINFSGYEATGGFTGGRVSIKAVAAENFTTTTQGAHLTLSTTPVGTTSAAEVLRVTSEGRIGVGVTSPDAPLHVHNTVAYKNMNASIVLRTPAFTNASAVIFEPENGAVASAINSFKGDLKFFTGATGNFAASDTKMTILTTGEVGIGTTSPTAQLHTTGTVRFASLASGALTTDALGNVTASSDERLKNIEGEYNRGLEDLLGIEPISYKWKETTGYDTQQSYSGFSAQNIQEYIPEAVGVDDRGYLTLSDRPIIATLVNAIKEQQQIIESQKKEIEAQSADNKEIIRRLTMLEKHLETSNK